MTQAWRFPALSGFDHRHHVSPMQLILQIDAAKEQAQVGVSSKRLQSGFLVYCSWETVWPAALHSQARQLLGLHAVVLCIGGDPFPTSQGSSVLIQWDAAPVLACGSQAYSSWPASCNQFLCERCPGPAKLASLRLVPNGQGICLVSQPGFNSLLLLCKLA